MVKTTSIKSSTYSTTKNIKDVNSTPVKIETKQSPVKKVQSVEIHVLQSEHGNIAIELVHAYPM